MRGSYAIPILAVAAIHLMTFACARECDFESDTSIVISCVSDNFNSAYVEQYEQLWNFLNESRVLFVQCERVDELAGFLGITSSLKGNSEAAEFFHEVIEVEYSTNFDCFRKIFSVVEDKEKIREFLINPLFIRPVSREELNSKLD